MAGTGSSASTSAGGAADIGGLDGPTPHDLLPTTDSHPEETVRYQTVVLTDMPGAVASRELKGTVNLGRDDLSVYDRPAEGMIITTEQSWTVEGVTLGRLLHSLSLAPGECTKVAVVGWERRTRGDGDETTVEGDALTSGTTQDRSISELANMIAREEQHGLSRTVEAGHSDSAGASGGLALFGASLGGSWSTSSNAGIATSVARTTGTRDVAAQVAQRISSRTGQLATVARSRQTTVVRETSQTEREQVSTRLVTNYNHMHAMSMQYYEVIHVYKVLTRTRTVERCLFVPLQELGFTPSNVKYFRALLAKAAPPAWAARIRAIDPFETVVRRLDGATATAATGPVRYDTTKLLDLSGSPRAPYGVRSDGVPVRFDLATRQWKALPTTGLPRAGLKKIAAAGDAVWGVDAENFVVQYLAPTWQRSRNDARDVSCGTDGSVYMIGVRGYLHRRTDSWLNLGFLAESVAVANRDRVWSCRQGKTWEVGGTGRVERESPGIVRMTGASDGSVWGMTRDFKIYSVVPGASTWTSATVDGTGMATYSKVGISDGRELWLLDVNGNAVQIASRGTLTAFDHPPSPDAGWAVRLEVWWDHAGIRGVRLTMPGTSGTHTEGVTSPDLSYATHTFKAGDRLLQVDYWTGAAAGGCLSGLRLTTQAGPIAFGPAADSSTPPAVTEDTGSVALCGFHGSTVKSTENVTYIASLGFYGRADSAPQAVLDHLNDNSRFYSQAVWVNADELTLSRVLANYHYAPSGETDAVPLGVRLDPTPVAVTANYVAFRWNFASEEDRKAWLAKHSDPDAEPEETTVGVATNGVFAEAVLGRSNAAEKIDLTRFWNWTDSPIPILPPDIAPVAAGSRNGDVDVRVGPLAASEARFQQLQALPDPTGLQASLQALTTANLFRDMSGLAEVSTLLGKGLELAAGNDQAAAKNATDAMKIVTEHMQKMAELGVKAAGMAATGGASSAGGSLSGLGGLLNQASTSASNGTKPDTAATTDKADTDTAATTDSTKP